MLKPREGYQRDDYEPSPVLLEAGRAVLRESADLRASLRHVTRKGDPARDAQLAHQMSVIKGTVNLFKRELLRLAAIQPTNVDDYWEDLRKMSWKLQVERRKLHRMFRSDRSPKFVKVPKMVTITQAEYDALMAGNHELSRNEAANAA